MDTNKKNKIFYWVSTGIIAVLVLPGIFFFNSPMAIEGMRHLGLPDWFRYEVSIGQFIGCLILIIPKLPKRLKEWAYVALGIKYLSAVIAHLAIDGFVLNSFSPFIFFGILLVSYIYFHKLQNQG